MDFHQSTYQMRVLRLVFGLYCTVMGTPIPIFHGDELNPSIILLTTPQATTFARDLVAVTPPPCGGLDQLARSHSSTLLPQYFQSSSVAQ